MLPLLGGATVYEFTVNFDNDKYANVAKITIFLCKVAETYYYLS